MIGRLWLVGVDGLVLLAAGPLIVLLVLLGQITTRRVVFEDGGHQVHDHFGNEFGTILGFSLMKMMSRASPRG